MANRIVPPSASALIGSLRGVGYSLQTAIADLIDNSIAASANKIDIFLDWAKGAPVVSILDDGDGMGADTLVEALRFGCAGPTNKRSKSDLGRFGLGLKTASLSQCRRITVVSKRAGQCSTFTWDLDHIQKAGDTWELIEGQYTGPRDRLTKVKSLKSGTLVLWEKMDFGRSEDRPDHSAFLSEIEALEQHLAMVFHRFLEGDARQIAILLNGRRIKAWDPFLEDHPGCDPSPVQKLKGPSGQIEVQGFVLPHRDRFKTEDAYERAGGPEGWTAQQGFYVYRHKRLLSAGGWLGLGGAKTWTREESSRLARIRVDIPNSADFDWRIDIRKAIARPPDGIRARLKKLADEIRQRAREIFVHRGEYGARRRGEQVARIWKVNTQQAKHRYTIDRTHELVRLIHKELGKSSPLLEGMLNLVEKTVPVERVWLDVTEQKIAPQQMEGGDDQELLREAGSLIAAMEHAGIPYDAALSKISAMDPFDTVENLAARLSNKKTHKHGTG
jgi:Histidine kinase-, DNA gyrase B-, and HSP90-like ATPase